jgi:hypothetical protein
MMDWVIEEMNYRMRTALRDVVRKELKKSSKKELIEFMLDNVDLLRPQDVSGE